MKRALRNPVTWVVVAIAVVAIGSIVVGVLVDPPKYSDDTWPIVLFRTQRRAGTTAFELTGWGGCVLVGLGWALTRIGRRGD